jgi:hypothetical protein
MSTMDCKEEAKNWMKKLKVDKNRIQIKKIVYLKSIIWMNEDIFCLIVISFVANLASLQIQEKNHVCSLKVTIADRFYNVF